MNNVYIQISINDSIVYVETTEEFVGRLFDYLLDGGYKVKKLSKEVYYEALKDGEVVYHANTKEIVDDFIDNNNKIKEIKMGVKAVNFASLVDDFIKTANKKLKEEEQDILFGHSITTKGQVKTLRFYSASEATGDRTVLYKRTYEASNPAEFIQKDINYVLYRELFYNAFMFFGINMDSVVKQQHAEKAVENISNLNSERPLTPEQAINKAMDEE